MTKTGQNLDHSLPPDPVIDAYKEGVDLTLIRENLKLTAEERILKMLRICDGVDQLRGTARSADE